MSYWEKMWIFISYIFSNLVSVHRGIKVGFGFQIIGPFQTVFVDVLGSVTEFRVEGMYNR